LTHNRRYLITQKCKTGKSVHITDALGGKTIRAKEFW